MADQLVQLLNQYGYQPIFLPRTHIVPPELYNFIPERKTLIRRGPLIDYMREATEISVTKGRLANIEGQLSNGKNHKATLNLLSQALKALGISALPKIDLGFTGSKDLAFSFTNATYRGTDPSQIDAVLYILSHFLRRGTPWHTGIGNRLISCGFPSAAD